MQPRRSDIEREMEADYVLERMQEVRDIVHELLESIQFDRITHHETGAESALEAVAAATFTVEKAWTG